MKFYLIFIHILFLISAIFLNYSCSSTEDYDNSDFTNNLEAVINDPPFVIVGNDAGTIILSSEDGINWTRDILSISGDGLHDITYGGGYFLTVGNASSTIYSADGFNWNTGSKTITSSIATYYKASYGNNIFV